MVQALMTLKILLPFQIFTAKAGVSRVVAETREGSFGLLPHRLDCIAAIAPGILVYETEAEGEVYVAVDEGVLVKTGPDVLVSVRHALAGTDLGQLRNQADYKLSTAFKTTVQVQQAIADAAKALALLDAIMQDAARRSAAVADIRARWP